MRQCATLAIIAGLALAGCSGGRTGNAVEACSKAIAEKLEGKLYALDTRDMAANAKNESSDVTLISSTATFDKGLASEHKQTYECRVRFESGKPPSVIGMQFNWDTADLKKSQQ